MNEPHFPGDMTRNVKNYRVDTCCQSQKLSDNL